MGSGPMDAGAGQGGGNQGCGSGAGGGKEDHVSQKRRGGGARGARAANRGADTGDGGSNGTRREKIGRSLSALSTYGNDDSDEDNSSSSGSSRGGPTLGKNAPGADERSGAAGNEAARVRNEQKDSASATEKPMLSTAIDGAAKDSCGTAAVANGSGAAAGRGFSRAPAGPGKVEDGTSAADEPASTKCQAPLDLRLLPPDSGGPVDPKVQAAVERYFKAHAAGQPSVNESLRSLKQFHNPAILEKVAWEFEINAFGSNYPPDKFDPKCFSPDDDYEAIRAAQEKMELENARRARETSSGSASMGSGPRGFGRGVVARPPHMMGMRMGGIRHPGGMLNVMPRVPHQAFARGVGAVAQREFAQRSAPARGVGPAPERAISRPPPQLSAAAKRKIESIRAQLEAKMQATKRHKS